MNATRLLFVLLLSITFAPLASAAPTTQSQDAAPIYEQAYALLKVDCPSNSNDAFNDLPPYSKLWQQDEAKAWDANRPAREMVRTAQAADNANWPTTKDTAYLNHLRALANELRDASANEDIQGNDAAAMQLVDDLLHMDELLQRDNTITVRMLVGVGIQAMAASQMLEIDSSITLTRDPGDSRPLQVQAARNWINRWLKHSIELDLVPKLSIQNAPAGPAKDASLKRLAEVIRRVNAERDLAAMSLACHLFMFEQHRWPKTTDELVPNYLPFIPIDPWSDGKQTLGYVVIPHGLPDESDRPLLFDRCESADGLFYMPNHPIYDFYSAGGRDPKTGNLLKRIGQFRDVVRWSAGDAPMDEQALAPMP